MNGVSSATLRNIVRDNWEIVYDGTQGFIGAVTKDEHGQVELSPCFAYVSNPNLQAGPNGAIGVGGWIRFVLPLEWMASRPAMRIRWTRRYRLTDFDKQDQPLFEQLVANVYELQKKLAAERAGLAVVPGLPANLPPPPGRS